MSLGSESSQKDTVRIRLRPMGETLEVSRGTPLREALFAAGVEFPCGGRGRCRGCRVRLLQGVLPVTAEDRLLLGQARLDEGWRLACRADALSDLEIELAQWEATILTDDSQFDFAPKAGLGIAVDVGTTTLAAQLLDLATAEVLAVHTDLNAQARHGADIMSRIEYATRAEGADQLRSLIREQVGGAISQLLRQSGRSSAELQQVALVGNTVMHHLFCGHPAEPLAHYPFESDRLGLGSLHPNELGWNLPSAARVDFLPCLGGFVGSDILAGIVATRLLASDEPVALVDLGTNGEMVVGHRGRLLCASTAAGPAFEGARISMGMRAATGAISEVSWVDDALRCRVLGNVPPRGLCGSGLVDAIAIGLDRGWIGVSGRFQGISTLALQPPVSLTQGDVRELQLAKGAIAAGLCILARQLGLELADVRQVHLAGAFGNYISRASARRIGLLPFEADRILPAGNTALLGAKMALFARDADALEFRDVRDRTQHVSLSEDAEFQDIFADEMRFPPAANPC